MVRKCVYTDKEAKAKDTVLPRSVLGEEAQNWAAKVPCNVEFLSQKSERLPTEIEMQAQELFHLLEMARLRVAYYEAKLAEMQVVIRQKYVEPVKKGVGKAEKKKEIEIKKAEVEKLIAIDLTEKTEKFFEKKKQLWDD